MDRTESSWFPHGSPDPQIPAVGFAENPLPHLPSGATPPGRFIDPTKNAANFSDAPYLH
jgi:hypothetical protein